MQKRVAMPTRLSKTRRRNHRALALALLALGSQVGCGREFYREWANQDVSEAVFEKTRDPRWRLDQFSIDPPAMARFANPYDPDRPPAPPDDFPAQALSPVPQWPDHRLIMPVESTGYLKLLEDGPRYESPAPTDPAVKPDIKQIMGLPAGTPRPPANGFSPFAPGGGTTLPGITPVPGVTPMGPTSIDNPATSLRKTGTNRPGMSPTLVSASPKTQPAAPLANRPGPLPGAKGMQDDGLARVAMRQDPNQPMPPRTVPIDPLYPPPATTTNPADAIQTPRILGDPLPVEDNLGAPTRPRRDLTPGEYRESEAKASSLAGLFVPDTNAFDEAEQAGLKAGSKPSILTMEKAFQLALVNSRGYQFQLENIYVNALPVTLQRFSFQPQFLVGISPTTAVGGNGASLGGGIGPAVSPANSFLYNTRETGAQLSTLNLGTVAGVGKLFDNGTRVLASFANSIVFNFVGRNPAQPTVRSFLPIQAIVPFLRGGGRAITLEALTQAERNLLYSVRLFAKYRQEFTVTTLVQAQSVTFGTTATTVGPSIGGGPTDPGIGFLNLVEDIQIVENYRKNLAVFERIAEVYKELINGESSGLSTLQLDQILQNGQSARSQLIQSRTTYRNDLDQYKLQLGMPPDTPMVPDRSRTAGFKRVFEAIDEWATSEDRLLSDLDVITARLPKLENIVLDGRSFQAVFTDGDDSELENLLLIAERTALENRLDLMNARAQLYDTWRQIRVSANALKGVFTVAATNSIVTPPTTNNPFGFLDQAKQFSLVINAELPLVRVAERNNFRLQLINYERQRRALQFTEDALKYQLRQEIRQMEQVYQQYEIAQKNLVLTIRQKDQAFEQIIAPPASTNVNNNAATQTLSLISAQTGVINNENSLVNLWYQYQVQRLQVYRDLGTLPYDEWEAFDELFPPNRTGNQPVGGNAAANVNANGPGAGVAPARRPGTNAPGERTPAGLGAPIPVTPAAAGFGGR